ncbi:hypothetical protein Rmet_6696 (plasmid) [Cupriavidus metallidurans CH34]|uniref:Uncharacterized protein n=1 Tax=Cupriavidus metallidurans (strain ATCC 43123 / DSM 2839 / NBRC 102507 / CH34) TaxID=266264 RepID=D3DYA9_CUPMC|nr:hypothetical protein Rmet_6696 [Cupriavidus metallidurans CH34]
MADCLRPHPEPGPLCFILLVSLRQEWEGSAAPHVKPCAKS